MSKTKAITKREAIETGLITSGGRAITSDEMESIRAMVFDGIGTYLAPEKFELLMQPPPKYAIKSRPGGDGAQYPYLKHGYIKLKLTQIFGLDWDFELLPVFSGEPYRLTPAADSRVVTRNPTLTTFGRLTVRVRNLTDGRVMIEKRITGFGSCEWKNTQEIGDALKNAHSDNIKVCAAPLGPALGLTLYWDDEAMVDDHTERERKQTELDDLKRLMPPSSIAQLLQRAASNWQISAPDICNTLACNIYELMKMNPTDAWQKLVEHYEHHG